jgi:hypothetical protein
MVFTLKDQHVYGAPAVHVEEEHVLVSVLPGLVIDLPKVFAR